MRPKTIKRPYIDLSNIDREINFDSHSLYLHPYFVYASSKDSGETLCVYVCVRACAHACVRARACVC